MSHTRNMYSVDALDRELQRRKAFPPTFPDRYREEWVSVAFLRAELAATPKTYPDREWLEFELALAERQAELEPHSRFYRVVRLEPTN
jgi:hypothetical protein